MYEDIFARLENFLFSTKRKDEHIDWDALLNPQFSEEMKMIERYQDWRKVQGHGGLSEQQRQYRTLFKQGTESFALETMDKTVAAFGLESRYPFMDKRLIEFCLALPAEQKLHNGWTRVVMRRAMSNILPDEVRWRYGKTDFSPNLTDSLVNDPHKLSEALTSLDIANEYIDKNTLNRTYDRLIESPSARDARQKWLGLSLTLWIRYAFGKEKQAPVMTVPEISKDPLESRKVNSF